MRFSIVYYSIAIVVLSVSYDELLLVVNKSTTTTGICLQ
jgi:hypothetical protein